MNINYEMLAERSRSPLHRGRIKYSFSGSSSNSPCGDKITIYVLIEKDGKVADARYEGYGCALATVSADILCDYLIGKKIKNACKTDFNTMVRLLGFMPSVGRIGCVKVSLDAFHIACEKAMSSK